MKEALIIFVRHPELGKVKTRLARDIGDQEALRIYELLLQHTNGITFHLACDKFVYYAEKIIENDRWENEIYNKRKQRGADLGERMTFAFNELFKAGYTKVVIIGSDCVGLTASLIREAFEKINSNTVVLGPSADGGYYLLGTGVYLPGLFLNKNWSTADVCSATMADIKTTGLDVNLLPELSDIDTLEDLRNLQSQGRTNLY